MSTLTFLDIFNRLIGHEGGYVNDLATQAGKLIGGLLNAQLRQMVIRAICV